MNLTVSQADAYFAVHLDQDNWSGQTDATKLAALTMADVDIAARLGLPTVDATDSDQRAAAFEQAMFLILNHDRLGLPDGEISAETIEDAGSRSYRSNPHPGLAPRALEFLRRLTSPRLSRG